MQVTHEESALRKQINRLMSSNWRRKVPPGQEVWLSGYTDASYAANGPHRGAAWGIWIRDHDRRVLRSAPCPPWVTDSRQSVNHAELCGVHAAAMTILEKLDTERGNIAVVKTDSQAVARMFGWKGRPRYPKHIEALRLVAEVYEKMEEAEIKFIVKWVKAHKERHSTQGYLNDRVDNMAGKARQFNRPFEWEGEIDREKDAAQKAARQSQRNGA